jgi:alkaline phosphatase
MAIISGKGTIRLMEETIMRRKAKQCSRMLVIALSIVFLASSSSFAFGKGKLRERLRNHRIKNVIVLIPDGCDEAVQTLARWYKGGDLQVDSMEGGGVKSHMANSVITGSAAAATAFASGEKTTVRFLGVGPRTDDLLSIYQPGEMAPPYAPVASVLEAAKSRGMSTGLVATSRITHATPAAFGCHIEDRGWDNDIMEHLVYNNIDVVFGGGARHLIPKGENYTTTFGDAWGGKRTDGENLMQVLLDRGYRFVDNGTDMNALGSGKVWGLFDDSHMQPDIDRQHFAVHEPSLAEMTGKAIELLSRNPRGFFLMVEGSQVDWAGHANDPIYMTTDFLAFDEAVKVACDFADQDRRTLVLAYPDHNTGGMKLGHYETAVGYTETTVEDLVEPLKGMKITSSGLVAKMPEEPTDADIVSAVEAWWGLSITQDDVDEIRALEPYVGLGYALSRVISKNHTVVGWTTHGHNGETVPLWVYGGKAPAGIIDNTMLAEIAADAIGVDLERLTNRLYLDLGAFTSYEIEVSTDADGQIIDNGVVKVGGWELPISKDYMEKDGNRIQLPGLTVYASGDANIPEKVYVSRKALRIMGLL